MPYEVSHCFLPFFGLYIVSNRKGNNVVEMELTDSFLTASYIALSNSLLTCEAVSGVNPAKFRRLW